MKIVSSSALLLVLCGVPARAQVGGVQAQPAPARGGDPVELKLLEIEQDADETLFREALLLVGRKEMAPSADPEVRKREAADVAALGEFLARKKKAIIERTAELKRKRAESTAPARPTSRVARAEARERQGGSEEIEKARVQVQLLQAQVSHTRRSLEEAINELARVELADGGGEGQEGKVEAARKKFEKAEARHVEYSKRLRDESARLNALEPQSPFGGMGGGMRGPGGGLR